MKINIILILILFCSCNNQTTYFSKEENMTLYANQTKENIHRPIVLDLTEEWIAKSDENGINSFKINVIGKKYLSLEINGKGFSFDENWLKKQNKTNKTNKTINEIEEIAKYLGISYEITEELIQEFAALGLNRYSKENDYIIFINETWLTFSKGYLYFPKTYHIKVNDTININDLTKGNYRVGWWNNFIIKSQIDSNWFEWYRPTGLKDTLK